MLSTNREGRGITPTTIKAATATAAETTTAVTECCPIVPENIEYKKLYLNNDDGDDDDEDHDDD